MTLTELHDMAESAMDIYAKTGDPITRSCIRILLTTTQLPLTEPQEKALSVLERQFAAYNALYIGTLCR